MKWILIWVIFYAQGVTSGSQEFNSKEDCEKARSAFGVRYATDKIECFSKGGINDLGINLVNCWLWWHEWLT